VADSTEDERLAARARRVRAAQARNGAEKKTKQFKKPSMSGAGADEGDEHIRETGIERAERAGKVERRAATRSGAGATPFSTNRAGGAGRSTPAREERRDNDEMETTSRMDGGGKELHRMLSTVDGGHPGREQRIPEGGAAAQQATGAAWTSRWPRYSGGGNKPGLTAELEAARGGLHGMLPTVDGGHSDREQRIPAEGGAAAKQATGAAWTSRWPRYSGGENKPEGTSGARREREDTRGKLRTGRRNGGVWRNLGGVGGRATQGAQSGGAAAAEETARTRTAEGNAQLRVLNAQL
jgi:hypothetical protein